jgi:predicted nucleotidyltransferase
MSIAELPIALDREQIAAFCRERGIRRLSLFGSVLRDDFDPAKSDIDVLVDLRTDARPGLEFFGWGEEFGRLIGHARVDFCSDLRPWLQPLVEQRALVVYDEQAS